MTERLLSQETLKDHSRVIWIDASVRFVSTGNMTRIKPQLLQTGGVLMMVRTRHSMYQATHPALYEYFPCDINKRKHTG